MNSFPIKKVLLVNSPLSMEERFGSLADGGFTMPPIGLAILGAALEKEGFEAQILDCETLGLRGEAALQRILEFSPDLVGFSGTTVAIYNAVALAELVKQHTDLPTIIGGVHVTALPEDTLERFPCFDYGVYGEGEITLPELLRCLNDGGAPGEVQGILYREDGEVIKTSPRPFIKNLDDVPYPAWHLLPDMAGHYRPPVFMFQRLPAMSIMTSRGCTGRCTFCNHSLFGNRIRFHSVDYVLGMIEELVSRYGAREIQIYDDSFTVNKKRLREFCRRLLEKKWGIVWNAFARVDMVDLESLKLMKQAGCWHLAYGIESGDPRVLKEINKGITLEQVERALAWTKEAGIVSKGYLMYGNVGETRESLQKTRDFALKLPVDLITTTYFAPMPGSEDYQRASKYGFFDNDWRKMSEYTPIFIPQGLTEEEIKAARVELTRAFYLRPRIIKWFLGLLLKPTHFAEVLRGGWMFLKFTLGLAKSNPASSLNPGLGKGKVTGT